MVQDGASPFDRESWWDEVQGGYARRSATKQSIVIMLGLEAVDLTLTKPPQKASSALAPHVERWRS